MSSMAAMRCLNPSAAMEILQSSQRHELLGGWLLGSPSITAGWVRIADGWISDVDHFFHALLLLMFCCCTLHPSSSIVPFINVHPPNSSRHSSGERTEGRYCYASIVCEWAPILRVTFTSRLFPSVHFVCHFASVCVTPIYFLWLNGR